MEINVRNLILEVTRKCNMKCKHCLRGAAQDIDMSKKIIDTVLTQFTEISGISFTGGEPALNIEGIEYFTESVISKSYPLNYFWMATNAKEYSPRLVTTLLELYGYCVEVYGDDEMCGLAVSQDKFHSNIKPSTLTKYQALSFYDNSKETDFDKTSILKEGYAKENGIGNRANREEELEIELDENIITVDQLYINAKGDVIVGCDYSYETQEKIKLGNIMEESLESILRRAEPEIFKEASKYFEVA